MKQKSNWVVKDAEKKTFRKVAKELTAIEGISINQTSNHLNDMMRPGTYLLKQKYK